MAKKGKRPAQSTIDASIAVRKGKPLSDEHRAKIGAAHKGKPLSEERKDRISKSMKLHYQNEAELDKLNKRAEIARKIYKDRGVSESTKSKISISVSKARERNVYSDTKPELELQKRFQNQGIRYEKQKRIGNMVVDFYLPQQNLVIEVDGCWWHGCKECCPKSQWTDRFEQRHQKLIELGYDSIRIWEHDLK